MTFPDVIGPNKIEYQFSAAQEKTFYETVDAIINSVGYYRYQAINIESKI